MKLRSLPTVFHSLPGGSLLLICFYFLLPPFTGGLQAQSQPDSTGLSDETLERVIEDAMTDLEAGDEADWSAVGDYLGDLLKRPLDLNTASGEDLMALPGMSSLLVESLQNYIREYGELSSVYELQAVPGFTVEVCTRIKPYVTVHAAGAKDMGRNGMHPAGPPLRTVFTQASHEFTMRYIQILEEQKGFTAPDTNSDGSLTTRYLGSAARVYTRYRMRFGQNFSLALIGEKDSGEEFRWNPESRTFGFDFTSGHIAFMDYGAVKRAVLGDYNIQVGQGLILSSGLGFGKGGDVILALKRQNRGVRPYSSVNENQFLRGAATTLAFGKFYFTGFASRLALDANITQLDTLTQDADQVSTLQLGGYHRTASELADKASLMETMVGGRVEFRSRRLTLGTTHLYQKFGSSINPGLDDYQRFYFSGDHNYVNGIDWDYTRRNFNIFGEVARSASGGIGFITGVMASLDPKVDVSLLYRRLDPDYHSTRGFVFSETPSALSNERGLYLGLRIKPFTKWVFSAFFDQYSFPWVRYQVSFPSAGYEYLTQLQFTPRRGVSAYVRWRSETKSYNMTNPLDKLETLVPTHNQHLRLHFEAKITQNFSVDTRIEQSWYRKGENPMEKGFLIYQDVSWKPFWKWKFTGRYAIFDAPEWNARIYAYENDVPGFYNIPAYTGTGSRYYAIIQFNPSKHLSFWLRYSRSAFPHDRILSSGLSEIQGSNRSEIKLQARVDF